MTLISVHLINWAPSIFYRFALAETVLHQSVLLGFLCVSAGNVFWQVGCPITDYFWVRQMFEL